MGGCVAPNCSNNSKNKTRLFRFPADRERRKKWILNCRRDRWQPTSSSQLCIAHFEDSQFEQNRQDNWKKLKQTAVPTIFHVPNPPVMFAPKRKKNVGMPGPGTLLATHSTSLNHFEESQFEQNRADNWKKLKATAVPTMFDVPKSPEAVTQKKAIMQEPRFILITQSCSAINNAEDPQEKIRTLTEKVVSLEKRNKLLTEELQNMRRILSFLTDEQLNHIMEKYQTSALPTCKLKENIVEIYNG